MDTSKPLNELEVRSSYSIGRRDGTLGVHCHMNDGSYWSCDIDGTNWKKLSLNNLELTEAFQKEIAKQHD